jgi:hypothetical protein
MKSMHRLLTTVSTLVALSGMFGAPVAQAGDEKTIPATGCVQLSGGTPSRNDRGVLFNTSFTSAMAVFCPLVRDNVLAPPLAVKVSVIDNSSLAGAGQGDVGCRLHSMNRFGTNVAVGASVATTGTNSAGTILTLPLTTEADRGTFGVRCVIARRGVGDPSSAISSLLIDETP